MRTLIRSLVPGFLLLIASCTTSPRLITVVNQCAVPILAGMVGGNAGPCGANGSCPQGTACNSAAGSCFWVLPEPVGDGTNIPGVGVLLPPNTSAAFGLINAPIGTTQFNGSFYGATGCDANGQNCQTACPPGNTCGPGVGPVGPVTQAEFTFVTNAPDTYDVTVINGVNVPIQMAPASVTAMSGANAFFCQTPGAVTVAPGSQLPACSWSYSMSGLPAGANLAFVAGGGTSPCPTGGCTTGVCGYAADFSTNTITQACGTQLGWWSADEICGHWPAFSGSGLDCAQALPAPAGSTLSAMLQCNSPYAASCYSAGASATCCGCPQWTVNGTPMPSGAPCANTNPTWTQYALPWAAFLKNACPTSYTFPYDDETSTFTCSSSPSQPPATNTMSYTITYCPGGKTAF
ncbi:MAG TPA: thaumatin family protein [Thermoanaerobaculia bacterium]|nr:thaumatin family protein [Thermoanaerobaculia bacterium]